MSELTDRLGELDLRRNKWIFLIVLVVFSALMAYGAYLGNVFETYHNGSTL